MKREPRGRLSSLPRALGVLLIAAALSAPAQAAAEQRSAPLSLDQAAARVQDRVGGRVLAAEVVKENGQVHYRIRVLVDQGRVKVYRVDPQTGRLY